MSGQALNIIAIQEATGALLRRVDTIAAGDRKVQLIQARGNGRVVAKTAKVRLFPSQESVSL